MNNIIIKLKIAIVLVWCFLSLSYISYHTQNGTTSSSINLPQTEEHPQKVSERILLLELKSQYNLPEAEAEWWASEIAFAAHFQGVPSILLLALIAIESNFQVEAASSAGAIGPAQVIPYWWNHLGYDLTDPGENIMAGASILNKYKQSCGNWKCAMAAYNVGITDYAAGKNLGAQNRYLRKAGKQLKLMDSPPLISL